MDNNFLDKFLKKYNISDIDENRKLISELYPYDPSSNKKYLHWLYERFIGEFGLKNLRYFDHDLWDNVSKALLVLDNYPQRFKNAELSTDIYSYNNIDDFIVAAEKAFQRSNKKIQLKDEIDMVDEFDGITILYPSTSDASCYYGEGTRWCVTNPSTYEDYMDKGNLFFILNRGSNDDDYKTALYIDAFGKIQGYDATDAPLKVSFGDVDKIEYDEYSGRIIYPKRVGSSIKKYSETKIVEKPAQTTAKVFANWVKSLGEGYEPEIMDIDDSTFYLRKRIKKGNGSVVRTVGQYAVADKEGLKELILDLDTYSVFNSSKIKVDNLIKVIGEEKLLIYLNLEDLFHDILLDNNRFRFFREYDIDDMTNKEMEKSPELNDLKKQFMEDPIEFYNDNIYKGTAGPPPAFTNYEGLPGMLFFYDHFLDMDRLLNDYPTYCIDAIGKPITWKYNGKDYYIMNIDSDNDDVYGE